MQLRYRGGLNLAGEVAAEHGVEVLTVVDPEAEIAAAITESGRIGVLATPTTVEGGAYRRALDRYASGHELEVVEVAAPDLAPIIQSGFPFDQRVIDTVRSYCEPFRRAHTDTLILGCTHYPLVAPMLQRILGRDVRLVTAGHAVAATAQRELEARGLEARSGTEGEYRFLCTGEVGHSASSERVSSRCRSERSSTWSSMPSATTAASPSPRGQVGRRIRRLPSSCEHPRTGPNRRPYGVESPRARPGGRPAPAASALQQEAKLGDADEIEVLQRERKKRLEAAEASSTGGVRSEPPAERAGGRG